MECILEIKNLNHKYGKRGFTNFSFKINKLEHICIIGQSKSGKTTLLKETKNYSNMNSLNNSIKKEISILLQDSISLPTVKKELLRSIDDASQKRELPENYFDEVIDYFKLCDIVENDTKNITNSQRNYISIIKELIINPDVIGIDCIFSTLTNEEKELIINYANHNGITIICVTNNLNDLKYFPRTCVMSNFIILMDDKTNKVLTTDILLKRLGLKLPLPIYLSLGLVSYEITNEIYYDIESLVDTLWK